jgi:hypothetical protein
MIRYLNSGSQNINELNNGKHVHFANGNVLELSPEDFNSKERYRWFDFL